MSAVINVEVEKNPNARPKKGLERRLSLTKLPNPDEMKAGQDKASALRDAATKVKSEKAAEEGQKVLAAQEKATSDKAQAAKSKAVTEASAATLIRIDTDRDASKNPKKSLVRRLSLTNPASAEELKARQDKAAESQDAALKLKQAKAGGEGKKVEAAQARAGTDQAKRAKAKAVASQGTDRIISVETDKNPKSKPRKGLERRLSLTKMPSAEEMKARQDKAAESRDAALDSKRDGAAGEGKKVEAAQARASTDQAKAAKAKAEASQGTDRIISVETDKNPKSKPKRGLERRLSLTKKANAGEMKARQDKAAESRDAAIESKRGSSSRKVEAAQARASTDQAKAAKARAEATVAHGVSTIISVETDKNHKKKAKPGLEKRLSITKKTNPEELKAASDKASQGRDAALQAKQDKAATESKKVEAAQARAGTDKAKAAKVRAEATVAHGTATVISVETDRDLNKKAKKGLERRLSTTKKTNPEEQKKKKDKADESRSAALQSKQEKAAAEGKKVEEAQVRAGTDKAKAAKARADATIAHGTATIISVETDKNPKKRPKKGLERRLSLTKKANAGEMKARQDKAAESRDAAIESKRGGAAGESKKVEEAKARAGTDKAKAAKARAEATVAHGTAQVISVDTDKNPKKKPKRGLERRLSLTKPPNAEAMKAAAERASESRDATTKSKQEKAAAEGKKVEAAQARANTDEAKAAKAKADAENV